MHGFSEAIDQLSMTDSLGCYEHLLMREDAHVLRRVFKFEIDGEKSIIFIRLRIS